MQDKKHGRIEKAVFDALDKFMEDTGQKATSIANEIRLRHPECKFSAITLYNLKNGKQRSISCENADLIVEHIESYGYKVII